ncbi:unnamed protein product [Echinostoma caproni]|uniref:Lysosomal Pro-X carboxypeptidase n=1 Tax=Echinostoma caproni TaxID=27848 RepID=A0A183AI19_9TREM|nr:unnamed protein product [Echinostoma caproni]
MFCLVTVSCNKIQIPWPPKVDYSIQKIDHFSFDTKSETFRLRFLYKDYRYKGYGPIFFYCGNEGSIENFWNNTGFMFELAETMHALVIFAEHRYYGQSLPFSDSFTQPNIKYLSVEQALADFAYLITEVKQRFNAVQAPVIAFGGSYGGMLAAYMRLRYPHLVTGALAASAPMYWVSGLRRFHGFFEAVTRDYYWTNPKCVALFKESYRKMEELAAEENGLKKLSEELRLCESMKTKEDYEWMLKWSRNAFVMMTMMDYPTEASFMGDLPAYPVNVSCQAALAAKDPISGIRDAVGVFYNSSQQMNLHDDSPPTKFDMFPALPLTKEQVTDYCQRRWKVMPAFQQLATYFGPDVWKYTSNIIFSNGNLDPWADGGIGMDRSDSVVALRIHGGAHHLDLRLSDPNDPPSVREIREAERRLIKRWIKEV